MKTRPLLFFLSAAAFLRSETVTHRLNARIAAKMDAGKDELPENYDSWSANTSADFKPSGYARIRREARRRRNVRRLSPKN